MSRLNKPGSPAERNSALWGTGGRSWADMSWADMSWADVSQEDAAEGDAANGGGYVVSPGEVAVANTDPDIAVPDVTASASLQPAALLP